MNDEKIKIRIKTQRFYCTQIYTLFKCCEKKADREIINQQNKTEQNWTKKKKNRNNKNVKKERKKITKYLPMRDIFFI